MHGYSQSSVEETDGMARPTVGPEVIRQINSQVDRS